jgi:hypothetical protein
VFWLSLACGIAAALFAAVTGSTRRLWAACVLGAAGLLTPAILARQVNYLHWGNTNLVDWVATLAIGGAGWILYVFVLRQLWHKARYGFPRPGVDAIPRGAIAALRRWRAGERTFDAAFCTGLLRGCALLSAAYVSFGLVFAGRHRDFPVWLFLPAVLALVIGALERWRDHGWTLRADNAIEETMLASWLVVAALLVPWLEDFANVPSLAWGLSALALGLAVLLPIGLQATAQQQAAEHADP